MTLTDNYPVTTVKGIGTAMADSLHKLGVDSVGDLLMHLPLRYDTYQEPVRIKTARPGSVISVNSTLIAQPVLRRFGHLQILSVQATDGDSVFTLTWFNMPYIKNQLYRGREFIARGRLINNRFGFALEQPQIYKQEDYEALAGSMQPVYATTPGITSARIRKCIAQVLSDYRPEPEYMPKQFMESYSLVTRDFAVRAMHFPESDLMLQSARRRLVFDEFFFFICAVRRLKESNVVTVINYSICEGKYSRKLLSELPYELTGAQKRVLSDIRKDMCGDKVMNRLIQGDVGSGKTILAFLALLDAAEAGYQGALMAPTEVLAHQHYENFIAMADKYNLPFKIALLSGSMTAAEKKEVYAGITSHEYDIVIGTHALIQKGVEFDRLALVITDEQHRFGVRQREVLSDKGTYPHVIVMSATPIPRTLAIIIYGDLDISVLDELPACRQPIKNCVVDTSFRKKAYEHILREIKAGHQAYIVCPKVDSEHDTPGENVVDYAEQLKSEFPPFVRIAHLHGRMRPSEKNEIMESFVAGDIDILVSTTVIEVGVDVPNATVMMIEDAEIFGLAQLHQLRGRVGRGDAQSYCIFVNGSGDPEKAQRLDILNKSNDGFVIAGEDLKMRGPGDVFGIKQSGALSFAIGDIFTDSRILQEASEAADMVLNSPGTFPMLDIKINLNAEANLLKLSL